MIPIAAAELGAAPDRVEVWRNARNVLAVRLDNLGDVLMTTPALQALATQPDRRLTLLASRSGAAIAPHVPNLAAVLTCDAPWVKGPSRSGQHDRRFLATLARRRFDAAVIFTTCTQSALPAALMCRMAGIPLRLAYSRENPYALLTDWVHDTETCGPGMRHEVERQLDLVATIGARPEHDRLTFRIDPSTRQSMRAKLAQVGADPGRPWIVVHPGSSAPSRRYPPERFGAAARALAAATGAQVVLAGGPGELDEVERVRVAMEAGVSRAVPSPVVLAGTLDLGELGALIADARLLVCNNSGPAHLAAASGTPTVVLYALTNPQHTPWRVTARVLSHEVPCRDCLKSVCPQGHHACLMGVEVEEVVRAGLQLWGHAAPVHVATTGPRLALPSA